MGKGNKRGNKREVKGILEKFIYSAEPNYIG